MAMTQQSTEYDSLQISLSEARGGAFSVSWLAINRRSQSPHSNFSDGQLGCIFRDVGVSLHFVLLPNWTSNSECVNPYDDAVDEVRYQNSTVKVHTKYAHLTACRRGTWCRI